MSKHSKAQTSPDGSMTVSGHLKELRNRLVICVVALVVLFLISLNFASDIVTLLTDIGKNYGYSFIYISPQELLLQYFSVSGISALCISMPLLLYHIWAFIQPGLKNNENKMFSLALIFGLICFIIGVLFAYKIMLPFMLRFLIGVSSGTSVTASVSVGNYVSFLMTIFIIFGIIFEMPMISIILGTMGIIRSSWMKKGTKAVVVIIFFVAAFVTPPDITSQVMVAVPMIALYELSIVLVGLVEKRRKAPADTNSDESGDNSEL